MVLHRGISKVRCHSGETPWGHRDHMRTGSAQLFTVTVRLFRDSALQVRFCAQATACAKIDFVVIHGWSRWDTGIGFVQSDNEADSQHCGIEQSSSQRLG